MLSLLSNRRNEEAKVKTDEVRKSKSTKNNYYNIKDVE